MMETAGTKEPSSPRTGEPAVDKPHRVGYWRKDGTRIEVVSDDVLREAIKVVELSVPDDVGIASLVTLIRKNSRLES
jgi:hypothetical protein